MAETFSAAELDDWAEFYKRHKATGEGNATVQMLRYAASLAREVETLKVARAVSLTVSPINEGDDGPLMSTDIYLKGRGVRLLINVPVAGDVTFTYCLDDNEGARSSGVIPHADCATIERLTAENQRLKEYGQHKWDCAALPCPGHTDGTCCTNDCATGDDPCTCGFVDVERLKGRAE